LTILGDNSTMEIISGYLTDAIDIQGNFYIDAGQKFNMKITGGQSIISSNVSYLNGGTGIKATGNVKITGGVNNSIKVSGESGKYNNYIGESGIEIDAGGDITISTYIEVVGGKGCDTGTTSDFGGNGGAGLRSKGTINLGYDVYIKGGDGGKCIDGHGGNGGNGIEYKNLTITSGYNIVVLGGKGGTGLSNGTDGQDMAQIV